MCVNNVQLPCQNPTLSIPSVRTEAWSPDMTSNPANSPTTSLTSFDDNDIMEFGPIKVKRRKKPAPTLATGRRSKYEVLNPDEAYKRDVRRARNRAAAERVRLNRLNVENQLLNRINELEAQEEKLRKTIEMLQCQKLQLETRVLTHDKLCRSNSFPNVQQHYDIPFLSTSVPTSTTLHQVSSQYFEDFFSDTPAPTHSHTENVSNFSTTMIPSDDLDMFLMDF